MHEQHVDHRGFIHSEKIALRKAEDSIAVKVRRLATAQVAYPTIDLEKAMTWCEQRTGKTLAPSQREALKTVLSNRVAIITGGPGVGKTTLVNSILLILRAKKVECLLCAPTGRAAKRLTETTGLEAPHLWSPDRIPLHIHRTLEDFVNLPDDVSIADRLASND